jgi:hypothetical protein
MTSQNARKYPQGRPTIAAIKRTAWHYKFLTTGKDHFVMLALNGDAKLAQASES